MLEEIAGENFLVNPVMINGFTHRYHYGESIFIFRDIRCVFEFLSCSLKLLLANRHRWDKLLSFFETVQAGICRTWLETPKTGSHEVPHISVNTLTKIS